MSAIGLRKNPSQEAPEQIHPVTNFRQHGSRIQLASQATYPKGDLSRPQKLLRQIPLSLWSTPEHQLIWLGLNLIVSQPEDPPHT